MHMHRQHTHTHICTCAHTHTSLFHIPAYNIFSTWYLYLFYKYITGIMVIQHWEGLMKLYFFFNIWNCYHNCFTICVYQVLVILNVTMVTKYRSNIDLMHYVVRNFFMTLALITVITNCLRNYLGNTKWGKACKLCCNSNTDSLLILWFWHNCHKFVVVFVIPATAVRQDKDNRKGRHHKIWLHSLRLPHTLTLWRWATHIWVVPRS
jgi:hypothetical protein